MSSIDAFVAEIRSTPPLPKFFMESPNWLEHIREPQKTLSLCCNTEAQSRVGQQLQGRLSQRHPRSSLKRPRRPFSARW